MATLMIKDLSVTEELDRQAMTAVRGGTKGMPSYYWGPMLNFEKNDFSFNAAQMLGQTQNTVVNNGNNVAFSSGINATVNPHQDGKNTINFG